MKKTGDIPFLPPVERRRLHDAVVEHLRRFIVEGTLQPGQKLNERELCELLDISRTPLREALKVLCSEGLIEISPHRGATVARLTEAEVQDAFELIGGLEALGGELACGRITDAEIQEIKDLHEQMIVCRNQDDVPGYYRLNQTIHEKIIAAARNQALLQTYLALNRRIQALRLGTNYHTPKWDQAIEEHAQMLLALDARDGAGLGAVLRGHLSAKRAVVLGTFDARNAPPTDEVQP